MCKRTVFRSLPLLLALFLAGCGGSPSEPAGRSVELRLFVSPATVSPSGMLDLTLVFTNSTAAPTRFDFNSGCQFNFQIHRGSELVWDHLSRVGCSTALTSFVLQPGESRSFATQWNVRGFDGGPAATGVYEARGQIMTQPRRVSEPVSFRVEG
jgi:Intracellular proteinase inhibitor